MNKRNETRKWNKAYSKIMMKMMVKFVKRQDPERVIFIWQFTRQVQNSPEYSKEIKKKTNKLQIMERKPNYMRKPNQIKVK